MVTTTQSWGITTAGKVVPDTDEASAYMLVGAGCKVPETQAVQWGIPFVREDGETITPGELGTADTVGVVASTEQPPADNGDTAPLTTGGTTEFSEKQKK